MHKEISRVALGLICSSPALSAQGLDISNSAHTVFTGADRVYTVAAGDLDNDGLPDLASAAFYGNQVYRHQNAGFASAWPTVGLGTGPTSERVYTVELADFNADGLLDVAAGSQFLSGSSPGWATIYLNQGGLSFGPPQTIDTSDSTYVLPHDINGDGWTDLVCASSQPGGTIRWHENSSGTFQTSSTTVVTGVALNAMPWAGDIDGDGDIDIAASLNSGSVVWLENDSTGHFTQHSIGQASVVRAVACGDLDEDGLTDLVVTGDGAPYLKWFSAIADQAQLTGPFAIPSERGVSLDIGDIDLDGRLDICFASYSNNVLRAFHNTGDSDPAARFGGSGDWSLPLGGAHAVRMTDIDGDGDQDLAAVSYTSDQVFIIENFAFVDCNGNGVGDHVDLATGTSLDCNANGVPDECDVTNGLDCNGNGIPDSCDIASGFALDCNNNGIPDDCDIANDPTVDANLNSVPDSCEVVGSRYWILSPVTGNWYAVTDQLEADDAAQMAVNLGGDLVTINSPAENDWLSDQFGDINNPFWIGLNDVAVEGQYSWLSGEPVTYTNWRAGQPDDAPGLFGADFAVLTPPLGTWNDEPNDASTFVNLPRGVVELASSDCDGNGLPDTFELLQDPSLDCDGNGIHDFCDLQDPALDCDGDGVLDSCQIAVDPSLDCDGNGAIDSCEILADVSLDCDANQFLDSCQIANDPSRDWNGDGLLDSCAGGSIVYCVSNENATGLRGLTQPLGSPVIADDSFSLRAYNLPIGQPGMFIMSRTTGLVNPFGGGAGVLCLGPPIRRFGPNDGFALQFSSAAGEIILSPPIGAFPGPNPVQPGEVLHFQLWHRENDPVTGAPRSNTSEGISVMFR